MEMYYVDLPLVWCVCVACLALAQLEFEQVEEDYLHKGFLGIQYVEFAKPIHQGDGKLSCYVKVGQSSAEHRVLKWVGSSIAFWPEIQWLLWAELQTSNIHLFIKHITAVRKCSKMISWSAPRPVFLSLFEKDCHGSTVCFDPAPGALVVNMQQLPESLQGEGRCVTQLIQSPRIHPGVILCYLHDISWPLGQGNLGVAMLPTCSKAATPNYSILQ